MEGVVSNFSYSTRWESADGKKHRATHPTLQRAQKHVKDLSKRENVYNVQGPFRSGRNDLNTWDPPRDRPTNRKRYSASTRKPQTATGLFPVDQAWVLPAGFVDTEADKHGPTVYEPVTTLSVPLSNEKKAEWAKNYQPNNKTCLWQ
jgi:hypothetical protein